MRNGGDTADIKTRAEAADIGVSEKKGKIELEVLPNRAPGDHPGKRLKDDYGWPNMTWGLTSIGATFASPVADAERVYLSTAFKTVAAVDHAGKVVCSHAGLTELFAACVRTFQHNLVGMLRDCPQRDERLGWLGDARAVLPAVLHCTDSTAILRRWCGLIADTQDPARQLRCAPMAPAEPLRLTGFRCATPPPLAELAQADNVYTAAATLLPWQGYAASGDRRFLEAYFPGIVAHLLTWPQRADWPLVDASQHGDHAAFPVGEDPPRTAKPLVSAALLLSEYRCALRMARVLRWEADALARHEAELSAALRKEHAAAFLDPASSQGTLALGLDLELVADPVAAAQALHRRLQRDGYLLGTGIILTRTLLRVLGRHGLLHDAWRMVTATGQPGWLWMLREGPGTLHENTVATWGFVSRNQPALGVVAEWLLTDLLGLRPEEGDGSEPGRVWRFDPPDLPELGWARGSVPTPYGPINVAWQREDGGIVSSVDAPAACRVHGAISRSWR